MDTKKIGFGRSLVKSIEINWLEVYKYRGCSGANTAVVLCQEAYQQIRLYNRFLIRNSRLEGPCWKNRTRILLTVSPILMCPSTSSRSILPCSRPPRHLTIIMTYSYLRSLSAFSKTKDPLVGWRLSFVLRATRGVLINIFDLWRFCHLRISLN